MKRSYAVVDVFSERPYLGNPVAVVLEAENLSTEQMQAFANWTNLSETTFVLAPTSSEADYHVRIFTPGAELPFAGHPTLGTCHAWQAAHASRARSIVQECAAGLIKLRRSGTGLAFAAPALSREGPVEEELLERIARSLRIDRADIKDAAWVDNGPGWVGLLLESAQAVLALRPELVGLDVGVVGPHPPGSTEAFEVRAFFSKGEVTIEDPVTGSLNAGLASWLLGSGRASAPYIVRQGTALGRVGRVHVDRDADETIWVGGATITCVSGEVDL